MKIRLISIDGILGDPRYNENQMEKEIIKAKEDKFDLVVFPDNSLVGESLDDLLSNEKLINDLKIAKKQLIQFIRSLEGINVWFLDLFMPFEREMIINNYKFSFNTSAEKESIENICNAEKFYIPYSNIQDFYIVCKGRDTESCCNGIWSNQKIIYFNGKLLASNFENDENCLDYEFNEFSNLSKTPYLNLIKDTNKMFQNILNFQGIGLFKKMKSMNRFKICLGISGGLDSTVSLIACVEIFKKYNIPLENIIGVTMPGLGTTERTYKNALALMKNLGITIEEIDLRHLLKLHLKNISQPEGKFDITFEQTQSRERTQVLLDIANRDNAIMIGTGCMSEFALGWMTYGGDHLSMYAINIGLPKTVVKMYAKWFINKYQIENPEISNVVKDILDGPVSPELLPIDENGQQHEKTESLIGDYLLQDFFIYYMTVNNYSISKIFDLTCKTFPEYDSKQILKWLEIFTSRYFTRAYKKNCYGDGLQIFKYSVSPWNYHIPSDINNNIWKQEIEELKKRE